MTKSNPFRVCYLDHTAKWSGGEIALFRTLSALDPTVVEPTVFLAEDGEFANRLQAARLPTHLIALDEKLREVRKEAVVRKAAGAGLAYLRYAMTVARHLREQRAQLVHCNSLKSDLYGAVAGRLARVPVLWHVRDHIDPSYLPGKAVVVFRKLAQQVPAAVITNSISTEKKLFPGGVGKQRARVVYDGLMESELLSTVPDVFAHWHTTPPRIGLLGRIVPWKGQHLFLEAAKKLTERGVEARYQIIGAPLFGEHAYESELKRQAESLGGRVEFLGFRSDVPDVLKNLEILAHCSITPEPFGQVVIEGMAEGLPVVASDGGGVQEIIEHDRNGLRTPMGSADALADALESLLKHPERASALGRAAHRRVRENFTAAHSARAVESFYREIL